MIRTWYEGGSDDDPGTEMCEFEFKGARIKSVVFGSDLVLAQTQSAALSIRINEIRDPQLIKLKMSLFTKYPAVKFTFDGFDYYIFKEKHTNFNDVVEALCR